MGSMIHLAVGRLEVDWGKNNGFTDHSALFQPNDLTVVPYYYADDVVEYQDGLSKPLWQVRDRIELLGHTLGHVRKEFQALSRFNSFSTRRYPFAALAKALAIVDVQSLSTDYGEDDGPEKFFRRQIFGRLGLADIVEDAHYVQYEAALGMENLSAYSILRLLAENPANMDVPVTWQFADVEFGGWAKRQEFVRPLDPENRFLIVTEGSSDAGILRHGFRLLMPHIADFFDFVDMQEGYPFTGTGNLFRFTQGLISIAVQNKVIILYDNDAEGVSSYNKTLKLNLPPNMRVMKLPNMPEFSRFQTLGPHGKKRSNINGRAAAIECYLDLGESPVIRWKSFNSESQAYQGELVDKQEYMNRFYKLKDLNSGYDSKKLEKVLKDIVRVCVSMREAMADKELERIF